MAPTYLGFTRATQAVIVVVFAVVPAALGWFLPWILERALDLPVLPFQRLVRLIESTPDPWLAIGAAGLGLVVGAWVGVLAIVEALAITVTDEQVRLRINGTTRTFDRARIGAVFLDGKRLVLLDPATRELAREKPEVSAEAVATGFRTHGYPWLPADPHRDAYRLWVPQTPDLPIGGNALLSARAHALDKKHRDDVVELRREIAALNIEVRDEGTRQYWRLVPPR